MGKRNKVTTRDVAEYAGVSQSTVSMILSGKKNVSFMPETESNVWEAARKLGYKKPVKKALAMENSLSNTILILAPLLTNSYYTTIIHSIVEQAQSQGYDVLTEVTFRDPERESQILSLPKISRLAGIIILYPIRKISEANAIAKNLPVVMVGEKPDNIRFDSVELDSKKPGFLMADHLLSLGHRQIAFICSPIGKHEISRLRRLEGIRMAYEGKGLDKELVRVFTPTSGEFREYAYQSAEYILGYEMCRKVLDSDLPITAFIGHNDMIAYGILAALRERGHRVPRDYSVAGFDNSVLSAMPQISLTTVEHAAIQKGKDAVNLIHNREHKDSRTDSMSRITRMEYEPRLIIRQSTGKVRSR